MRIIPIGPRVLVRRDERVKETGGGIVIPEDAQKAPVWGVVVEVGDRPASVSRGQRVLFGAYAGTEIKVPGDEGQYLMLRQEEIMAVEW